MSDVSGIGSSSFNPFLPVTAGTQSQQAPSQGQSGQAGSSASSSSSSTTSPDPNNVTTAYGPASLLISNAQLASSGARGSLALGGSGSSVSVLGAAIGDDSTSLFGSMPTQNSAIMNQILQTATKRFSDMLQQIQDTAAQKVAGIDAQNNAWITAKSEINNANAAVSNGQDAVTQVTNDLLTIRDSVALAGTQGEDVKLRAGQFDDTFNLINSAAGDGSPGSNLVGDINRTDFTPNQIQYGTDPNGTQSTLTGSYVATDYRITQTDGSVWVPDLGTDTLTHYSEIQGVEQNITTDGLTLPDSASTRTGLKLVSYDPNTNAISVQVTINPSDPPRTITGTLQRTGIGLMPSWFYDGLTTDAGRKRAYADISAAEVNVSSVSATLQTAADQVGTDSRRADAALSALTQQQVQVNQDELTQQQDLQTQSEQQLSALQTNLQSLQSVQQNYLDMLSGAVDDPLSQSLIDMQI